MDPFDLSGPEFLLYYLVLSAVVIGGLALHRRASEAANAPKMDLADPYLVAYLRGGEHEMLRVALVSLIDRGLLTVSGTQIKRADHAVPEAVRRAVDKALLNKFARPGEATAILYDPALKSACAEYEELLKRNRLLPDASVARSRWTRFLVSLSVLGGVGAVKIIVALARGRTNIIFLLILMAVAIALAAKVSFPRLTARGAAALADIQTLYAGLKERAASIRPGGASVEALMLAAAFGVGALAGDAFVYTKKLFPRAEGSASGSSSCGSSCGGSCGSSCGGGGCGGCGG